MPPFCIQSTGNTMVIIIPLKVTHEVLIKISYAFISSQFLYLRRKPMIWFYLRKMFCNLILFYTIDKQRQLVATWCSILELEIEVFLETTSITISFNILYVWCCKIKCLSNCQFVVKSFAVRWQHGPKIRSKIELN